MMRFGHVISVLASALLLTLAACSGVSDSRGGATDASTPTEEHRFDPTASRTPQQSKSLTLSPDWQPPAPTRSRPARLKPRVKPSKHWGVPARTIGPQPSDAEIRAASPFPKPLRAVPGSSTPAETDALAAALRKEWYDDGRIEALESFLEAYPASRWAPAIHVNLGSISYERGYFQSALAHWKAGWELAKGGEDEVSKDIANLGLAESAKMNARIGRLAELDALLAEAQKRTLRGDARVKIASASEGAWMMHNRPGIAFRCGPYALVNVAKEQKLEEPKKALAFLEKSQSPAEGFSIPEIHRMAGELGLKLQIAKRDIGAPVIAPAVVHWKLGHFAAVVREEKGGFLLKDPTFGKDMWITPDVIDREASGYFLVPAGTLPSGWSRATVPETAQLYGKGFTEHIDQDKPSHKVGGLCQSERGNDPLAMATYRFYTLGAGATIEDTPISYTPAYGPDVRVQVKYSHRQIGTGGAGSETSFGPQFVSNWAKRARPDYSFTQTQCTPSSCVVIPFFLPGEQPYDARRGAVFDWVSSYPVVYKTTFPDGRQEYYEQAIGTVGSHGEPPTAYLSRIVDPQGNEVTIDYDATYPSRIHQIVDATGLATEFHYDYPNEPTLVTSIDDPYGRTATFAYAVAAGELRLQSIEDPYGIVSSFSYDDAGEVVAMTTPYGTTRFELSDPYVSTGLFRYVEATDPLGQKERVEFNIDASTGIPSTLESPQPNSATINFSGSWNNYRNSFYWDKSLMKVAPGDYQRAHLFHWLHWDNNLVTDTLESERPPLEGRIFYNYPNQVYPNFIGSSKLPTGVGRVVKDATGGNQTQATKFVYNARSNVTKITDPVGRETVFDYDTNGIDIVAVKQKTGASTWTTVASYTYGGGAPAHLPTSVTDGAGKTTTYTYSSAGQVLTMTNAKNEVASFTYETNTSSVAYGLLLSITGDVPGGNRSFTYDAYGRVQTTTDSEGYTLTFGYDALDRLRTITYPDGTYEQREYEDHSLVATRDREGRWTRHMYNGVMERVVTQDPALRTAQFQWCRCGGLKRFVDGNGSITEWERDAGSRVTKKMLPDGSFETFTYDLSGRLATQVDALSRTTTYSYAVDDRLLKKDYSDAATPDVTYAYDAYFPRLTSRVDGSGTTTFTYHPYGASTNGAGQVSLVNGPLADDTQKRTYDELGRLKKLELLNDALGSAHYSEEYTFDARGRVTAVANNLGSSTYGFVGQSGRPSTVTLANGMQSQYDYFGATGDFLLKQIKNRTAGGAPSVISQFDYTYRGDRSVATWQVEQGSGAKTWTFGYDDARQLTSAVLRDVNQVTPLESLAYGYDRAGNRIQVGNGTAAPKNYETNNLNQLLAERDYGRTTFAGFVDEAATVKVNGKPAKVTSTDGGAPFKFEALVDLDAGANTVVVEAKDGNNNTATKTYTVPTTGDARKYEYDASGNLRFEKTPNNTVVREYRWDQQNRLVKELHGTHESSYEYDGASRRWRITEKENGTQTKQETFVWCGSRICQKRIGSTVVRSYFGNGFEESGPTKYFYTRDHLGSVREVVANDGTTVASRLSYDPWGKVTESGSGALSDFTYTGHHYDRATGLNLAQYRGYDAGLGRWISRDPIGLAGGVNLYGYVDNDPVNFLDPTGEFAWAAPWVAAPFAPVLLANPIVPLVGINIAVWGAVGYNVAALVHEVNTPVVGPLENRRKGERGWAGKPDGTPTPDKKKPTLGKDGRWYRKDQNGKRYPMPKDWKPPQNGMVPPFRDEDDDDEDGKTCP